MKYCFLRFPGGKAKAVTLSYDDGTRADKRLHDTITPLGLKCTFNINSGNLAPGRENWCLTEAELRVFLENGHEIAVHGEQHIAPGSSRPVDRIREVLEGRLQLEQRFGRIIRGMAYPDSGITMFHNGASYRDIRRSLEDLGIVYSRSLGGDNDSFRLPEDWYNWIPTAHHDNPNVLKWAQEFVALEIDSMYCAMRYPRLFYLWGHAFEFDGKNNWDHLDKLCGILSGREDVWYATNMEIYEYVTAYDRLVFSVDHSLVHNPTLKTVWFDMDGVLYVIQPGETLILK